MSIIQPAQKTVQRSDCEIVVDYMPPYPRPGDRPSAFIVRHVPTGRMLRYSHGPAQGHFWDCYGDDYQTRELANIALNSVASGIVICSDAGRVARCAPVVGLHCYARRGRADPCTSDVHYRPGQGPGHRDVYCERHGRLAWPPAYRGVCSSTELDS